jgi:hypothetical protein
MIDFSKRLFWDVDIQSLNPQTDRFFIIERVMNYGLWNDFIRLIHLYGKDIVKTEVVKSAYLKKDVLNFLCLYLNLKPSQFKCYKRRQLTEPHWDY